MLNKLRCHTHFKICWLLQKPTDLDLHCLQRQGISGFSRTRVNIVSNLIMQYLLFGLVLFQKSKRNFSTSLCSYFQEHYVLKSFYNNLLNLILLNPDMHCLCKQCRSRSFGVWRNQLIWIGTVYHSVYQQSGSSNLTGWQLEVGVASFFIQHGKDKNIKKLS